MGEDFDKFSSAAIRRRCGDRGIRPPLQEKALRVKTEENSRIVPFVSSMMEGIDIRETIRNWVKERSMSKRGRLSAGRSARSS